MKQAPIIDKVVLRGYELTIEEVVAVARYGAEVSLAASARHKIERCRTVVDVLVEEQVVAYGINTGFGALRSYLIPQEEIALLQQNLIRSHACGVGEPFAPEVVRAAILLRANALARGNSGVCVATVAALLQLLNLGICPVVPCQGSVGASGDLCPLSHIALVLIADADGQFFLHHPKQQEKTSRQKISPIPSTPQELAKVGFTPVILSYKEGLALNNGTQMMSAVACLALYDTWLLLHSAEMAFALSLEASQGVATSLDERIHRSRPLKFQQKVAKRLRGYIDGSAILTSPLNSAMLRQARQHCLALTQKLTTTDAKVTKTSKIKNDEAVPAKTIAMLKRLPDEIESLITAEQHWLDQHPHHHPWQISHDETSLRRVQVAVGKLATAIEACLPELAATPAGQQQLLQLEALERLVKQAAPAFCPIQDDYSFRCNCQVAACAWRAWDHACKIVAEEINAATDNPLIFPPQPPKKHKGSYRDWLRQHPDLCRQAVCSGGNFHGEPVGMVMDYLKIALCEIGSISERRIATLVDAHRSQGLPPFLADNPGLNSGLMIPQYTAAALVSENKILAHPATVDSIPTSAGAEDHVSMGTIAARHCAQVLNNVQQVVAIELFTAHQAVQFRLLKPGLLAKKLDHFFANLEIRNGNKTEIGIGFYTTDRVWAPMIYSLAEAIRHGQLEDYAVVAVKEGQAVKG